MRKKAAAWGAVVVFILLGALLRAHPSRESHFSGEGTGRLFFFLKESRFFHRMFPCVPATENTRNRLP